MVSAGALLLVASNYVDRKTGYLGKLTQGDNVATVSQIISGFAFTMVGFLAAIVALLLALGGKAFFERYRKRGYLDNFLFFYLASILTLFGVFFGSFLVLVDPGFMKWLVVGTFLSVLQQIVLIVVSYNIVRGSNDD